MLSGVAAADGLSEDVVRRHRVIVLDLGEAAFVEHLEPGKVAINGWSHVELGGVGRRIRKYQNKYKKN